MKAIIPTHTESGNLYVQALLISGDLISISNTSNTSNTGRPNNIETEDTDDIRLNIDGGFAAAIYLSTQRINGGSANG